MDKNTTLANEMLDTFNYLDKAMDSLNEAAESICKATESLKDFMRILKRSLSEVEQPTDDDAGDDEELMSLADAMMSREVEQPTDDDAGDDEELMSLADVMESPKVEQSTKPKLVAKIVDKNRKVKTSPKTGATLFDDPPLSNGESDS